MSGHSKWSNIKRRKEASDSVKGAIFTKMAKELAIAVRQGGADPESNSRLKDAIAKAKSNNMPNDNISRAIKKASGSNDGDDYEEIVYEGYGPAGVAIMVRALTNNRNRTAGDVRHIYDKYGGNMGVSGSVAFMFQQQGSIIIDSDSFDDEEQVMMDALEAGAQDFISEEDYYEVITAYDDYYNVKDALEAKGYTFADTAHGPAPVNTVTVEDEQAVIQLERLLEKMEENDDIQDVYHNWDN
ncbi:MAG TPA: YebC/PmpR family DNA-binding transcriptional regulator [Clostridiaceae bacterium]|jgi:YebC/PmpR family DNA-binding regulatory protein|nr:YebC/PmpR family DNA-binding transcriptional regulator [Clostridiaceae bacterium]